MAFLPRCPRKKEDHEEGPMEYPFVAENAEERTRLRVLVGRLNDHDFAVHVGGGWTIAATLAHLAFWDQLALVRARRRGEGGGVGGRRLTGSSSNCRRTWWPISRCRGGGSGSSDRSTAKSTWIKWKPLLNPGKRKPVL